MGMCMYVCVLRVCEGIIYICVCVMVCVCPTFPVYISLTMGQILIKLSENIVTSVRLIVLKFHINWSSVDVIMTSFLFL